MSPESPAAAGRETQEGGFDAPETGGTDPEQGGAVSWRVRPADDAPHKRWVVFAAAFGVLVMGSLLVGPLLGILGSVMILATTAEFWLGTVYKLDREGASSRTGLSSGRILWQDVRRAVITPVGIKLSPLEESTRMAPFRGIFLRFGGEDRVRIERAVRSFGGNDVRFLEGTAD